MGEQILTRWVDRTWTFDFPPELHPAVLSRLRGMPPRAADLVAGLTDERLRAVPGGGWSIVRHVGHVADLDVLLADRLDAYEAGARELPAADMSNRRTMDVAYEEWSAGEVVDHVTRRRAATIARLEAYPPEFFGRSAWHGRLRVPMRVVDSCVFIADHDDHHLALAAAIADAIASAPA